jgi:tetratricopeptide (TPR) repeat protein
MPRVAEPLVPAQMRIARRTAQRLRGGGLVFAIGQDPRRRAQFEAALREQGLSVAARELDLDGDPWAQVVSLSRGGRTPCVHWRVSDGAAPFMATLNLGRERFAELSAGLLMWIGGLDAIAEFPSRAPDLWAYRAGVEWVVSLEDFRAQEQIGEYRPVLQRSRQNADYLAGVSSLDGTKILQLFHCAMISARNDEYEHMLTCVQAAERPLLTPSEIRQDKQQAKTELAKILDSTPSESITPDTRDAWDRLHPFDAVAAAINSYASVARADGWEVAAENAPLVIDALLALGLTGDAHAFTLLAQRAWASKPRRRLALHVAHARVLLHAGAAQLGADYLARMFDEYRVVLATAHALAIGRLTLDLLELIRRDLVYLTANVDELLDLAAGFARDAIFVATREGQPRTVFELRIAGAAVLRESKQLRASLRLLEEALAWAKEQKLPAETCRCHLEIARVHAAATEFDAAVFEVDRGNAVLLPPSLRSELLLERAKFVAADGDPERGRSLAEDARNHWARGGATGLQLQALQLLAEPFPNEGSEALDGREQAAIEALALAAPSGLIEPHARALANYARVHFERGRLEPAVAMLAEAREVIAERYYGPARTHVDQIAAWIESKS